MLIQNPFPVTAIIRWINNERCQGSWLVSPRTTTATPGAFCKGFFVDSSAHIQPATTSNRASTVDTCNSLCMAGAVAGLFTAVILQ